MKKNTKLQIAILLFVSGFIFMTSSAMFKNEALNPPVVISPDVPTDVSPDVNSLPGLPIALFDDYSWRLFLAMVWPAKNNQRGVADASLPLMLRMYLAFSRPLNRTGKYSSLMVQHHPPGTRSMRRYLAIRARSVSTTWCLLLSVNLPTLAKLVLET